QTRPPNKVNCMPSLMNVTKLLRKGYKPAQNMIEHFKSIIHALIRPQDKKTFLPLFDCSKHFDMDRNSDPSMAKSMNAAFLIALTDGIHPKSEAAKQFLSRMINSLKWGEIAGFYMKGIDFVHKEISDVCLSDIELANRMESLSYWVMNKKDSGNLEETIERIWSLFFPEAAGIANRKEEINALREKRAVNISELNRTPITDPARQILFTSNVLLTIPPSSKSLNDLSISDRIKEKLAGISEEQQIFWYDHPVPIGVEPYNNEVLYGLTGLEEAIEFERKRGNMSKEERLTCLLSLSVTHRSLHEIAKIYLEEVLIRAECMENIDVYVFTETDASRIIEEIISPAAEHYLLRDDSDDLLGLFGVDGEYGRHYSFLKAVSAFWSVLIQPEKIATFKIDLDQVFPQKELLHQTGSSAFDHFKTPLWGARGLDSNGQPIELGMIAGALVNEEDIDKSLFTPDVLFPDRELSPDEYIFFSPLPQALSTEAEMLTRYANDSLDGKSKCIQRIHVTGGTNGILVDSLRRHRPFTPSFMGRAEDQAYILSVLFNRGERLAYAHKDGLIMRHDKDVFAQEAIQSAQIAKLVGDYVRILYFSEYAGALTGDAEKLKDSIDPFTGCFVSKIPKSVVYLRFACKAASFFSAGEEAQGLDFIKIGAKRIMNALEFASGKESKLKHQYEKERLGWNLYYDTLSAIEDGLKRGDGFAKELKQKGQSVIDRCLIRVR
ncbi:hypothetical protein ACFL7M_17045, partial [Thermodesulfobacteriota bacterium]